MNKLLLLLVLVLLGCGQSQDKKTDTYSCITDTTMASYNLTNANGPIVGSGVFKIGTDTNGQLCIRMSLRDVYGCTEDKVGLITVNNYYDNVNHISVKSSGSCLFNDDFELIIQANAIGYENITFFLN